MCVRLMRALYVYDVIRSNVTFKKETVTCAALCRLCAEPEQRLYTTRSMRPSWERTLRMLSYVNHPLNVSTNIAAKVLGAE